MTTTILSGDCRELLKTLPDSSVQMCLTSPPYFGLRQYLPNGHEDAGKEIGLERTPDAYVAELVAVFREVRRVLRDDGVLWLNIGDSYAAGKSGRSDHGSGDPTCRLGPKRDGIPGGSTMPTKQRPAPPGYKPKDLIGIPWLTAFALRADGWYLRSDCIWSKPNPMPESVTDRPTKSHEYVFLLTKKDRYFWDAEGSAETITSDRAPSRKAKSTGAGHIGLGRTGPAYDGTGDTRNMRSVWTIATQPYAGAHFATMPPDLAERCIKAGSSERGCCPSCGAPWKRMTETEYKRHEKWFGDKQGARHSRGKAGTGYNEPISKCTTGWKPTCKCADHTPVPCTVLDPFGGAGTTGLVADRLGRNAVLIDLNPQYRTMARDRIVDDAPLFAEVSD